MIFSERMKLAETVEEWCKFRKCPEYEIIPTTVNVISVLDLLGYLRDKPKEKEPNKGDQ